MVTYDPTKVKGVVKLSRCVVEGRTDFQRVENKKIFMSTGVHKPQVEK